MNNESEYKRNFSVEEAYVFLRENNLKSIADEIQISQDHFKSYTTTLKRAKIVKTLTDNGLLAQFVDKYYPSGKTKKGQTRIQFWLKLYDRSAGGEEPEEEEETESSDEKQFAYEKDLQSYLANHLNKIEPGLKLYQQSDDISGLEFPIGNTGRRIDILAIDKSGVYVIIELKVSRGYDRTAGQVLYYQVMVKKYLNASKVRIIIVANEVSEELKLALETIPNVELFEYILSMELKRVSS
jgi:hypothetical protein